MSADDVKLTGTIPTGIGKFTHLEQHEDSEAAATTVAAVTAATAAARIFAVRTPIKETMGL